MVKLAALCAALLSGLAFAPAAASDAPSQPPHFSVKLIAANGSGCPSGSAAVRQVNSTELRISYRSFSAADGPSVPPLENRENCLLALQVSVPSGWTYGIAGVGYRGFAWLDRGARGIVTTSYYLAGQPWTIHQSHTIYGPRSNYNYAFSDYMGVVKWAPCHFNDTLNVDISAQVFPGSNSSFVNELDVGSTDVGHLSFMRC